MSEKDEQRIGQLMGRKLQKPRPSILPWTAIMRVLDVMEYGARKYATGNWLNYRSGVYVDAALRHLIAHLQGEIEDAESGHTHLAHAATNLLFALELAIREAEED